MAKDNTIDYYLKTAWQSVANSYNQAASKVGLTQASCYVLINIHKEGTAVSQIASILGMRSTSLSRMLSAMEKQNLIYREAGQMDKRSVKVFLTPLCLEKRKRENDIARDFNNSRISHTTERERLKRASTLINNNQLSQRFLQDNIQET